MLGKYLEMYNIALAKKFIWLFYIQSHHFKANISGKVEAVTDFIFLNPKITADGDYSHEIKRYLLLGRKVMTNL